MSSSCSVVFDDICGNAFYFNDEGSEPDMMQESFRISPQCFQRLIQSKDNKYLLLNDQQELQLCDQTISQQADCRFCLRMYNDSTLGQSKGRAVILYANKGDKKMVVCCNERKEICPVAMDLPQEIKDNEHKAVFYLTELSVSHTYTFESSVYLGKFLGFEPDENNPSLKKLVLHQKCPDEVDDPCEIIMR